MIYNKNYFYKLSYTVKLVFDSLILSIYTIARIDMRLTRKDLYRYRFPSSQKTSI